MSFDALVEDPISQAPSFCECFCVFWPVGLWSASLQQRSEKFRMCLTPVVGFIHGTVDKKKGQDPGLASCPVYGIKSISQTEAAHCRMQLGPRLRSNCFGRKVFKANFLERMKRAWVTIPAPKRHSSPQKGIDALMQYHHSGTCVINFIYTACSSRVIASASSIPVGRWHRVC